MANPTNTTCYLGALLQALFQSTTLETLALAHVPAPDCGPACAWCLLRGSCVATSKLNAPPHDPSVWKAFFDRLDATLPPRRQWQFGHRQQDPVEAWCAIVGDAGRRSQAQQKEHAVALEAHCGTRVRSIIWSHYKCGCPSAADQCKHNESVNTHIELMAPPPGEEIRLSELLDQQGNAECVDIDAHPACGVCNTKPSNTRTLHIVGATSVLLISLNRFRVDRTESRDEEPVFAFSKSRSRVEPDLQLVVGGQTYDLKAVLLHLGESAASGHYVCYARQGSGSFCGYNDSSPVLDSFVEGLPGDACTDARLFVYESSEKRWPDCRLGHPRDLPGPAAPDGTAKRLASDAAASPGSARKRLRPHRPGSNEGPTGSASAADPGSAPAAPQKVFMDEAVGADQVDRDARALLQAFVEGKDARKILESFPSFVTQTGKAMPLNACNRHLERCINSLLQEQVNSTAALETQYFGDSANYPLVVPAHACMLAHGFPPSFFLDAVYTIVGSLPNKELHVQLGRYKSRSRHWIG